MMPGADYTVTSAQGPEDPPETRLTVFAFLWAAYTLFHQAIATWSYSPVDLATSIAGIVLLCRPANLRLFLILNLLQVINFYDRMPPELVNHAVINMVVSLTVLTAALRNWLRSGRKAIAAGDLYSHIAPIVRVELLIAYGWAAFHKYNADFLHPSVSAAAEHYLRLGNRIHTATGLHLLPTDEWALVAALVGVIVIETSVPLLLAFHATRMIGIAVALLFHFVLGVDLHADFSAELYALLFFFTPADFLGVVRVRWSRFLHRVDPVRRAIAALRLPGTAWAMAGFFLGVVLIGNAWNRVGLAFLVLWGLYGLAVIAVFFWALPEWFGRPPVFDRLRFPAPLFVVFPLLVLVNGACPYLGLKTRSCFAMFSNLRSELRGPEDRNNHLFMPSSLKLAGFQEDLVRILESNDPLFAGPVTTGDYRTYFEFRRRISDRAHRGIKNISVTYIRGGVQRTLTNAETDPELSRRYPYLMRKFLLFGDVSAGPRQKNRH